MKKIVWILSIFLFSTVTIQAENNTTEQKLFEQNYQLQQQKEQIKELEEKLRKYTDDKIEDSNKRIEIINGSVSRYTSALTWFGIIIALIGTLVTILLVGIAWSSRNTAIATAREESKNWIDNKAEKELQKKLDEMLKKANDDIAEKANKILQTIEEKAREQRDKHEKEHLELQKSYTAKEVSEIKEKAQDSKSKNLKDKTFYDYWSEILSFFLEKDYDKSLGIIEEALRLNNLTEIQKVQLYFAKGVTFGKDGKNEEAVKIYDELIDKYKDSKVDKIQEQVVIAINNKGFTLGKDGKKEEAIKIYDELIARYKNSKIDGVQEQVAMAIFNKYELLIIENKTLSKEDKEWIKNANLKHKDKASFGLLTIIDNAKKISQDLEVAKWLETYKDIKSKTWRFDELKKWINSSSYEGDVKSRINSYIDTFKNHLHRD